MMASVIFRIIAIIAALIVLSIAIIFMLGLPMEESAEVLRQEQIDQQVDKLCPSSRQSPTMVFLQLNGDCGRCENPGPPPCNPFCNDASAWYQVCQDERPDGEVTVADYWQCDAPEGGSCMVTKISYYQWVYNGCRLSRINPILGFNDYRIYKGTDPTGDLDFEEWDNCSEGYGMGSRWWDLFCADDECKYISSVSPILDNKGVYGEGQDLYFSINFVTAIKDPYDRLLNPEYGICEGTVCKRHEEEFHHYELKVAGRYCCPEGTEWNTDFQACCGEDDCADADCREIGGTWLYGECWFMGSGGESCSEVCEDKNAVCKNPDDWASVPKDCALHEEVFKDMGLYPVPFNCTFCLQNMLPPPEWYSPYSGSLTKCYYKNNEAPPPFDDYMCDAVAPGGKPRICACEPLCPGPDLNGRVPAPSYFAGTCQGGCHGDYYYHTGYGRCYWDYLGHAENDPWGESCIWRHSADCAEAQCTAAGCI